MSKYALPDNKLLVTIVRMCTSRIDYVQRAMNAQPLAYRKAQKVILLYRHVNLISFIQ